MKMLLAGSAIAATCLVTLGLAACSPSTPAATDGAAAAPETAAAPAAPAAPAASAAGIEGPAVGKWRMTISAMGMALPPQEVCVDKQVSMEEAEKMQQKANIKCAEQSFKREGAVLVGRSVCSTDIGGKTTTITTDTKVTGDFSSKYTMDMVAKMDPAPMPGMEEQKTSITAERLGDCDPK
jgi:hypothetical protein